MLSSITAGDTYSELVSLSSYLASDGWVVKQRFVPRAAGTAFTLTASAEGDDHRFLSLAATTAGWAPGAYTWSRWVEKAGEVHTVASGQLTIAPDPRNLNAGTDGRSQARKALDDARAAFAAWTPMTKSHKIADREREFNSTAEILRVISYWVEQVAREEGTAVATKGGRFYLRAR